MKKIYAIILLLSITPYSVSVPRQITKPYTPSFWTRHPTLYGITTGLLAFAALPFMTKHYDFPHKGWLRLATSYLLGSAAAATIQRNDLDLILIDPAQALKRAMHKHSKKITGIVSTNTGEDQLFVTEYQSLTPECRHTFETSVDNLFTQQLSSIMSRPLEYVGCGSQSILKDLIILSRALAANPTAKINIHLIDSSWTQVHPLMSRLHKIFPEATLTSTAHNNVIEYKKFALKSHAYPDVVVGVNITGRYNESEFKSVELKRKSREYAELCSFFPEKQTSNIILTRNNARSFGAVYQYINRAFKKIESPITFWDNVILFAGLVFGT